MGTPTTSRTLVLLPSGPKLVHFIYKPGQRVEGTKFYPIKVPSKNVQQLYLAIVGGSAAFGESGGAEEDDVMEGEMGGLSGGKEYVMNLVCIEFPSTLIVHMAGSFFLFMFTYKEVTPHDGLYTYTVRACTVAFLIDTPKDE